ncbi:hypothetical protein CRG98_002603 [Punica granatum]|uniref:Glycoside hydrolase family 5 domain-containing protein n=1 Tax=Punica granatum TaxID=22663 RepID=A0A2I0L8X4_PUNGR|nr:hypothetical protein CRG98_002603 [Punica granatum]
MLFVFMSYSCIGSVQVGPIAAQAQGPLFTDAQWIVDGAWRRVKLACVNWLSHLQPVPGEGLDKQPADGIMNKIKSMGFNCVRFTWPLELVTNSLLASLTVKQSFQGLGLSQALTGITASNSWAPDLTLIDAFKRYMQQGAEAVHAANPNVLVILSGLDFDKDVSFLQSRSIQVSFMRKLVFEVHWYSYNEAGWTAGNLNDVCGKMSSRVMGRAGFLAQKNLSPLFLSEFGVDARGTNADDNRYLSYIMAMAAAGDWDFAVWGLHGSYFLREGMVGMEELYGLLDYNWNNVRNRPY